MKNIDLLKQENNLKTFLFFLLAIVTLGLYELLWMYNTNKLIKRLTGIKVTSNCFVIVLFSITGWGLFFSGFSDVNSPFYFLANILAMIAWFMSVTWSNAAKNALIYHCLGKYNLKLKTNTFYVVIFNVFYINYIINSLGKSESHAE